MKPARLRLTILLTLVPIFSLLSQSSYHQLSPPTSNAKIAELMIGELIQAIKQQDISRLEHIFDSKFSIQSITKLRQMFLLMNNSVSRSRFYETGTTDFLVESFDIRTELDTIIIDLESKFARSRTNLRVNSNPRISLKIRNNNGKWRFVSLDGFIEKLSSMVDLEKSKQVESTTSSELVSPAMTLSQSMSSAINFNFTNKTVSHQTISWPIDQNSDGKLTETDAIEAFERRILYSPKDAADVVYSTGEEVYFVLDEVGGYIAYLTTQDKKIRFFDPQGTSLGAFNLPKAIAADVLGYVYVLDTYNNRLIRLHYNSSTKLFDSWVVLTNQLNQPLDLDISYGMSLSNPNDDIVVVANTGAKNILVLNASNGSIVNTIDDYWYCQSLDIFNCGSTVTVPIDFPISLSTMRWGGGSGTTVFAIMQNGDTYSLASFGSSNIGTLGPFGYPKLEFPVGSQPSKVRIDAFENWAGPYPNIWVLDERNGQLHKFCITVPTLTYLCSTGSNGFGQYQFNGPKTLFITQNYTSSSIYLDLLGIERYTSESGGKWLLPGSDILNLDHTVASNGNSVTFSFVTTGNSSTKSALIKNSAGQVVANRSSDLSGSPGNQVVFWNSTGYSGNFTLELYFEHVGGVSSVSKTYPFSVIRPLSSVTISGPTTVYHANPKGQPPNCYTWTANVTGGVSPYTYVWKRNGYTIGSNSPTYSQCYEWNGYSGGSSQFTLRVDVTDSQSSTVFATKTVTEYNSGGGIDPKIVGEEVVDIPTSFSLSQNYPNPFNPETEITFALPEPSVVRLTVLDILGREVAVLEDGQIPAGYRSAHWNGRNGRNEPVSSGMYFYRLTATGESGKSFVETRKMIITK